MSGKTHELSMTPEIASAIVAKKCAVDKAFRRNLRENPRQALGEAAGMEIPADLDIVLHENRPGEWHVPVPGMEILKALDAKRQEEDSKQHEGLSDEQLEQVSSGVLASFFIIGLGVPLACGIALGTTLALASVGTAIGVTQTRGKG